MCCMKVPTKNGATTVTKSVSSMTSNTLNKCKKTDVVVLMKSCGSMVPTTIPENEPNGSTQTKKFRRQTTEPLAFFLLKI